MSKINNSEFINIMNERGFIHQITDMRKSSKRNEHWFSSWIYWI